MPAVSGTGLADVLAARGAAFGDLFNDGKRDVVINCLELIAPLGRAKYLLTPNDTVESLAVIQNKNIGHSLSP
jgi:hypothetical protein